MEQSPKASSASCLRARFNFLVTKGPPVLRRRPHFTWMQRGVRSPLQQPPEEPCGTSLGKN